MFNPMTSENPTVLNGQTSEISFSKILENKQHHSKALQSALNIFCDVNSGMSRIIIGL